MIFVTCETLTLSSLSALCVIYPRWLAAFADIQCLIEKSKQVESFYRTHHYKAQSLGFTMIPKNLGSYEFGTDLWIILSCRFCHQITIFAWAKHFQRLVAGECK